MLASCLDSMTAFCMQQLQLQHCRICQQLHAGEGSRMQHHHALMSRFLSPHYFPPMRLLAQEPWCRC